MKEQYARNLREGTKVDTIFALLSREIRAARTGDAYLSLEVGDRSGRLSAVMFRPAPIDESVPVGSVVRVRGTVTTYRGVRRISVESLRPESMYDREDLLASSVRERRELLAELRALVRQVKQAQLRRVLRDVFGAPGFIDRFAACPAGMGQHRAYVGGLLEHTVSVASLCAGLAGTYVQADHDLLVASALLHDVGKVEELSFDTSVEYTDAGRLVGHVVLGDRMVTRAFDRLAEPAPALALKVSHAILAHHGGSEGGAAREPSSLEALLLSQADRLDGQAAAFLDTVSGAAVLEERWTDAGNGFGRPLMVPGPSAAADAGARRCA
jgi:3'-5' exoribonuclease